MGKIDDLIELGVSRGLITTSDTKINYTDLDREEEAHPEEFVRAATYVDLVVNLKYPPSRIAFEVPVPKRHPPDYADIVIFDDDEHKENYLVVEAVAPKPSDKIWGTKVEQGFGNTNGLRASLLLVTSGERTAQFDVASFPANEREANKISAIPENYGRVPTFLHENGGQHDLQTIDFAELAALFTRCHDVLWSGGKLDPASAFDEMSKLLFAKIEDERNTQKGSPYGFQVGHQESPVSVAERVRALYADASAREPDVFVDEIEVSDSKVAAVVPILQGVSLSETDLDAKGQAFEQFLGVVFRGSLGQYFTRRQIVEFMTAVIEPSEKDMVIDPSCGSGGFLLYTMKRAFQAIEEDYAGNDKLIMRKKFDFARKQLFGVEINEKIARVAMMDMIVNDDGHTNIENGTGLARKFKNPKIADGRLTVVLTNPPFGTKIKSDDRDALGTGRLSDFKFGQGKKSALSENLFLERYAGLLTSDQNKNPRMGVLLTDGALNNPSNVGVIEWIRLAFRVKAVIALPPFAFRKAGSGVKTSVLFAEKRKSVLTSLDDAKDDAPILFAIAEHIGYDSTLRSDKNELPQIVDAYKTGDPSKINGTLVEVSDLADRLDPRYYLARLRVREGIEKIRKSGVSIVKLAAVFESLNAGQSPEGGVTKSVGAIPAISIEVISTAGEIEAGSVENFVPQTFFDDVWEKAGIRKGDILIAKDGATTGKTGIIEADFPYREAICTEHIFRCRVREGVDPSYVHAFLNGELGQLQLQTIVNGGAQGGIGLKFAEEVEIPLPDIEQQIEIAQIWRAGSANAARMEGEAAQQRVDAKIAVDAAFWSD